jgi:hypothetical protein
MRLKRVCHGKGRRKRRPEQMGVAGAEDQLERLKWIELSLRNI